MRARKGRCLETTGNRAEAEAPLVWALAHLDSASEVSRGDIYFARMALGRIRYTQTNYAAARSEFSAALPLATAETRRDPLIWFARSGVFEDQSEALARADEALALVAQAAQAGQAGQEGRRNTAAVRTVRARILLNQGNHGAANSALLRALGEQGGLDRSVNASDIATRSDLAISAILLGNPTQAQRYLAFTGAGQLGASPFGGGGSIAPPPCGSETGLQPDDMAIVEFGIGLNGAVAYATTVYLSRPSDVGAAAFAEAVRNWSWRHEDVAGIEPLLRAVTRVELRCSTASQGLDVYAIINAELDRWLAGQSARPFDTTGNPTAILAAANTELESRRAAGRGADVLAPLMAIADNPLTDEVKKVATLTEALSILETLSAPVAARVAIETRLLAAVADSPRDHDYLRGLRRLLARNDVEADALSSAVLKLSLAERVDVGERVELLSAIANDTRLPATDPLKVAALVRLANLQAAAGQVEAARASYAQTGLEAQQCALVDARPSMQRSGASSSDYPLEAQRWGFEGWARVEFDIRGDGRTANRRAVIVYPPLVFRHASVGIIEDARFTQTFRPDGNLGCGGASQTIRFNLPE
ncbi:MAG: hypothetical protein ABL882_10230 [Sphingopyxis sp.]